MCLAGVGRVLACWPDVAYRYSSRITMIRSTRVLARTHTIGHTRTHAHLCGRTHALVSTSSVAYPPDLPPTHARATSRAHASNPPSAKLQEQSRKAKLSALLYPIHTTQPRNCLAAASENITLPIHPLLQTQRLGGGGGQSKIGSMVVAVIFIAF